MGSKKIEIDRDLIHAAERVVIQSAILITELTREVRKFRANPMIDRQLTQYEDATNDLVQKLAKLRGIEVEMPPTHHEKTA